VVFDQAAGGFPGNIRGRKQMKKTSDITQIEEE
jgi:hypothetical protein